MLFFVILMDTLVTSSLERTLDELLACRNTLLRRSIATKAKYATMIGLFADATHVRISHLSVHLESQLLVVQFKNLSNKKIPVVGLCAAPYLEAYSPNFRWPNQELISSVFFNRSHYTIGILVLPSW